MPRLAFHHARRRGRQAAAEFVRRHHPREALRLALIEEVPNASHGPVILPTFCVVCGSTKRTVAEADRVFQINNGYCCEVEL